MDGRTFIFLVLSIGWMLLCQRWFCCWMQVACPSCSDEPINTSAIGFLPGSSQADTSANFQQLIEKLRQSQLKKGYLEISGHYSLPEQGNDELGLDRARAVRQLITPLFPNDSVVIRSQRINIATPDNQGYHPMVELQWLPISEQIDPPAPGKIILFFENSEFEKDIALEKKDNIKTLANYAIKYKKSIRVDGHTNRSGDESKNILISRRRATFAQELLQKNGLPEERLIVKHFGSQQPLNSTKSDLNRRVEIYISN